MCADERVSLAEGRKVMSIEAIGTVVTTGLAAITPSGLAPPGVNPAQAGTPPPPPPDRLASTQANATVTTLSDEARAQQAAAAEPAPVAAASTSTLTKAVSSDWAAGAPAVDDAVVQEALDALDEASRENAQAAIDVSAAQQRGEADLQQKAVLAVTAAEDQRQDAIVLAALNAGIRLAYGALPSPLSGDPVLRAPGHLDVIA
jgi:hypothetical protein